MTINGARNIVLISQSHKIILLLLFDVCCFFVLHPRGLSGEWYSSSIANIVEVAFLNSIIYYDLITITQSQLLFSARVVVVVQKQHTASSSIVSSLVLVLTFHKFFKC
jgi:hypothetical protein